MKQDLPILAQAPPLDPAWLAHEDAANLRAPKPPSSDPIARQPVYAAECRQRNATMLAPGARDHHLAQTVTTRSLSAPSTLDNFPIPLLQYDRVPTTTTTDSTNVIDEPVHVIIYYHGGGLRVGEADSEDLSCRRLVAADSAPLPNLRLYSVGYRLRPQHPASTCVADSIDAFTHISRAHPTAKIFVVGSSSGGQLAAHVTQHAHAQQQHRLAGVLLRCPVTSDACHGVVPALLREMHTSSSHGSFETTLLGRLVMDGLRDGLERMPLEARREELVGMPRTWVQVCTNDVLYSDGACYVELLRAAGVEVRVDLVWGWPHTFWLKAPQLDRALAAELAMLEGLAWAAGLKE